LVVWSCVLNVWSRFVVERAFGLGLRVGVESW